ncbi:hypothetical protein EI94DRAFT_1726750, partial [Lactarius quietus]
MQFRCSHGEIMILQESLSIDGTPNEPPSQPTFTHVHPLLSRRPARRSDIVKG